MTDGASWSHIEVLVVSPTPTHPQDHGNRKRIFEICQALKSRGARVHFVHYPAEHDWRHEWPQRQEEAMKAAWDSYQLAPTTRPLHSPPAYQDHDIDEWADPSVSGFLGWVCGKRRFDIAIVNYTWMSFSLEAIPASIYKVLDTHDVFGDRRLLLEANGIAPEFFHTTREGETRGVARADLVWAIKEGERVYFEQEAGARDCLTMLHAEPQRGWWSAPPSTDGWLRAGVIGARNSVNRRNLEEFLHAALPVLHKYMAPVKIVIAGGISDEFASWDHPNIEVLGRVPEVEDFYRGVDVVIAPMRFSTGLKIKVSEALASGAPLIAHAHAMEGYPTREPLHLMPSFEAIAMELVKLSFEPSGLTKLAARSRAVCAEIQACVDDAIEATRGRLAKKLAEKILVIAPLAALDRDSLLNDHFHTAIDYLRFLANLEIYFVGAPTKISTEMLRQYDLQHFVFFDPELRQAWGEDAPETWTPADLPSLLAGRGYARAYVMADCREALLFGTGALRQAVVRHDAVALSGGDPDALIDALRGAVPTIVVGASGAPLARWADAEGVSELVYAPFRRNSAFSRAVKGRDVKPPPADIIVLGHAQDPAVAAVLALGERLGAKTRQYDLTEAATAALFTRAPDKDDPLQALARARLLVDLSADTALAAVTREAAAREGVPCLSAARGPTAAGALRHPHLLRPATLGQLLRQTAKALVEGRSRETLTSAAARARESLTQSDAGWSVLWRILKSQGVEAGESSGGGDAIAALFESVLGLAAGSRPALAFERAVLNRPLVADPFAQLDLTIENLTAGPHQWQDVRFLVGVDDEAAQLEFSRDGVQALSALDFPEDGALKLRSGDALRVISEREGAEAAAFLRAIVDNLAHVAEFALSGSGVSVADQDYWLLKLRAFASEALLPSA